MIRPRSSALIFRQGASGCEGATRSLHGTVGVHGVGAAGASDDGTGARVDDVDGASGVGLDELPVDEQAGRLGGGSASSPR